MVTTQSHLSVPRRTVEATTSGLRRAPRVLAAMAALVLLAMGTSVILGGESETPQIASRSTSPSASLATGSTPLHSASQPDLVTQAKQAVAECRVKYAAIRDYTCTFVKQERIDGKMTHKHVMDMKYRGNPESIYFKFRSPNKGREVIHVAGRNGGKLMAHDVGIGKFVAGTLHLDPRGSMAMEDCRHPITEAGIGPLIETVSRHWNAELTAEESRVAINPNMRIGSHGCTMIESIHPVKNPSFLFHMVRLYIDHEHGLPIRFEAYEWPKHPGAAPELVEEYTYLDLRTNIGLAEHDFDPNNRAYSFGRF